MKSFRRNALTVCLSLVAVACASGPHPWFSPGPRPPEIAGVWIDVALTSSTDTVAWVLAPNGEDRTRHISITRDSRGVQSIVVREKSNGFWYLSGRIEDTTRRAICYKRRVRDGATCLRFLLDTVAAPGLPRRLRVTGDDEQHPAGWRVFLERAR